jgi:molybdopterin converting factor small subunit
MMKSTVEYFGQLQHITGVRTESLEVAEGTDVSSLLIQLADRYGDRFRDFVFDGDGKLRRSIPVVVDDSQIAYGDNPSLRDGVRVMILSPIAGG